MDATSLFGDSPDLGLFGGGVPPIAAPIPRAPLPADQTMIGDGSSGVVAPAPRSALLPPTQPKQSLLGRVHDFLLNSLGGGPQEGYDGLLSPSEQHDAQPSLLRAIFNHNPSETSAEEQARLDHLVALHQMRTAIGQQQNVLAARKAIVQQYPLPTSGKEADMAKWAEQVYPALLAAGDKESITTLTPLLERYAGSPSERNRFQAVQAGDAVYTFDPMTGQYTKGPDRGLPQDKLDEDAQNRQIRLLTIRQQQDQFDHTKAQTAVGQFNQQNKMLTDSSNLYANAKAAIMEARQGNPAALKSAILNFAQSVDAKAQLRQSTINYIQHIDPSFRGDARAFFARFVSGTLPPEQLAEMDAVLDHIHADQRQAYAQRYSNLTKRVKYADVYAATPEEIFDLPDASALPPVAGGADKVRNMMGNP